MAETIVVKERHGLPYSKGLMAQSLSASGLAPERAYELARVIERRLGDRREPRIDIAGLRELTMAVLRQEEGEDAVRRFRDWRRLDRLERPLIVMVGGTTGVGKSTLAAILAHRLGISRVIATDVIRQVLRAFFTHEAMPSVHYSAFEAGQGVDELPPGADADLVGYERQAERVATGIEAIAERACDEGTPLILEGVHAVPGRLDRELRKRCVAVEALLVVEHEELHRGHFSLRTGARPAERYLERFEQIRKLQHHLVARARAEGVAVVRNTNADETLGRLMGLVLDAVGEVSSEAR